MNDSQTTRSNPFGENVPNVVQTPGGKIKVGVGEDNYMPDPIQQPGMISVPQPTVFNLLRSDPRVEAVLGEAKYTEKVEEKSVPQLQGRIEDLESKLNVLVGFIQGLKGADAGTPAPVQATTPSEPKKDIRAELGELNYQDLRHKAKELDLNIPRNAKKADIIEEILNVA